MGNEDDKSKDLEDKLFGFDESQTGSGDISKLIKEIISNENIEGKTDLNANQIVAFARAAWYAKHYKSEAMATVILYLEKFLQSKDRKGRTELVSAITGIFKYDLEKSKAENKGEKVEI